MTWLHLLGYIVPNNFWIKIRDWKWKRDRARENGIKLVAEQEIKEWIASNSGKFKDMCKENLSVAPPIELNGKKAPTLDELVKKRAVKVVKKKDKENVTI